jgi:predicted HD phosphohydrolase
MADDPQRMHFRRMDEGTDADFAILAHVHQTAVDRLPDVLLGMLTGLQSDQAFPVNRLDHSLQTATRALRDDRDEEYVVCALLHDVGESLGPFNHGEIAAAVLRPFISHDNYWMLAHHPVFQVYFFGQHLGLDPNERDEFITSPYYDRTVEFTARYDQVSFDPDYRSEPIGTFEPMVRRVLDKSWSPPS